MPVGEAGGETITLLVSTGWVATSALDLFPVPMLAWSVALVLALTLALLIKASTCLSLSRPVYSVRS